MSIRNLFILLFIGYLLSACGPQKAATGEAYLKKATPGNIIKAHEKAAPDFQTLNAKLRGSFEDGNTRQSVNISLRIKKNDTIWMSAQKLGFSLAKLMVTPNGVQFYEKINGRFFDGDFSFLQELLGVELDFDSFQNLLLGRLMFEPSAENYVLKSPSDRYELKARDKQVLLQDIQFDKKELLLKSEHFTRPGGEESIQIRYPSNLGATYSFFPEVIEIVADKPAKTTTINLRYRSLELDQPVSFPFQIPADYKQMKIKK